MSKKYLASSSILLVLAVGAAMLAAGRNVSVAATRPSFSAASYPASQALVPRVTVIVDNRLPVQSSTGIALNPDGTIAWITEEIANSGRLARIDLASGAVTPVATGLNQPGHFVVGGAVAFVAGNMGDPVTLARVDLTNGAVTPVSHELGRGTVRRGGEQRTDPGARGQF